MNSYHPLWSDKITIKSLHSTFDSLQNRLEISRIGQKSKSITTQSTYHWKATVYKHKQYILLSRHFYGYQCFVLLFVVQIRKHWQKTYYKQMAAYRQCFYILTIKWTVLRKALLASVKFLSISHLCLIYYNWSKLILAATSTNTSFGKAKTLKLRLIRISLRIFEYICLESSSSIARYFGVSYIARSLYERRSPCDE